MDDSSTTMDNIIIRRPMGGEQESSDSTANISLENVIVIDDDNLENDYPSIEPDYNYGRYDSRSLQNT